MSGQCKSLDWVDPVPDWMFLGHTHLLSQSQLGALSAAHGLRGRGHRPSTGDQGAVIRRRGNRCREAKISLNTSVLWHSNGNGENPVSPERFLGPVGQGSEDWSPSPASPGNMQKGTLWGPTPPLPHQKPGGSRQLCSGEPSGHL